MDSDLFLHCKNDRTGIFFPQYGVITTTGDLLAQDLRNGYGFDYFCITIFSFEFLIVIWGRTKL
jgi:hypothetical protein